MKKVISNILIIFILIMVLFEFAFSNSLISYAEDEIDLPAEQIENVASLGNGFVAVILWIPKFIVTSLTALINQATSVIARMENTDNPGTITPYKIFFGKYDLLSVNMFEEPSKDGFVKEFRNTIATWYYMLRLVAISILLVILVYVGIRMALASVADDKAKYKKMLFDWVVGLALIFVIHYIAIFTIYCNDAIVHAIEVAYSSTTDNAEDMINAVFKKALVGLGLIADAAMIVYIGIVFQTIFYLLAYINRMLKVGFLLVISPLITVTYAIDKIGDGKAQALESWLKEYIYTILLQPFHCIIYFTFISTAFTLVVEQGKADYSYNALSAGILAILCIKFINDAERIVKKIFGIQDGENKTALAAGAVMGVAMAKNATKIAKGVKGGAIGVKSFGTKLKSDLTNEAPKLRALAGDGLLGKGIDKVSGGLNKASNLIDKGKNAVTNSRVGKKVDSAKSAVNRKINGAKTKYNKLRGTKIGGFIDRNGRKIGTSLGRKAISTSAAIMGFAATYATGDTDALSAIGYGSALGKGTEELFSTSSKRNENDGITDANKAMELMHQDVEEQTKEAQEELKEAQESFDNAKPILEKYKEAETYDRQADDLSNQVTMDLRAVSGMKKGSSKYAKAMKNIKVKEDKIKKLRERANDVREKAKEDDKTGEVTKEMYSGKDGTLIKAAEAENNYKKRIEDKDKKARAAERELREFYSAKATEERLNAMRHSVTDQTIKDKATEIETLIQKMISKKHELAKSGNKNGNNDEIVSYEDMMDGKRMASLLQANIEKDFVQHSNLSSNELLKRAGGEFLSTDYGSGEVDKDISSEMSKMQQQLQRLVVQQQINYHARGIDKAADIDKSMGRYSQIFDNNVLDGVLKNASYMRYLEEQKKSK